MFEYLGKKELFDLVHSLKEDIPDSSFFAYSRYEGIEWLDCNVFSITCQRGGNHIVIREKIADKSREGYHTDMDTYILGAGKVLRRYHNYELRSMV